MAQQSRQFNFRLDPETERVLEGLASSGHCSQGQAIRDALWAFEEIKTAGLVQVNRALAMLTERIGDDTVLIVYAEEDENGEPLVQFTYSWPGVPQDGKLQEAPEFTATGHVVGDRVEIFINFDEYATSPPCVVGVGDEYVRVPSAQLKLDSTLSWPPKENEALRYRLSRIAHAIDADSGFEAVAAAGANYLEIIKARKAALDADPAPTQPQPTLPRIKIPPPPWAGGEPDPEPVAAEAETAES